jgi:hypothetical protein
MMSAWTTKTQPSPVEAQMASLKAISAEINPDPAT